MEQPLTRAKGPPLALHMYFTSFLLESFNGERYIGEGRPEYDERYTYGFNLAPAYQCEPCDYVPTRQELLQAGSDRWAWLNVRQTEGRRTIRNPRLDTVNVLIGLLGSAIDGLRCVTIYRRCFAVRHLPGRHNEEGDIRFRCDYKGKLRFFTVSPPEYIESTPDAWSPHALAGGQHHSRHCAHDQYLVFTSSEGHYWPKQIFHEFVYRPEGIRLINQKDFTTSEVEIELAELFLKVDRNAWKDYFWDPRPPRRAHQIGDCVSFYYPREHNTSVSVEELGSSTPTFLCNAPHRGGCMGYGCVMHRTFISDKLCITRVRDPKCDPTDNNITIDVDQNQLTVAHDQRCAFVALTNKATQCYSVDTSSLVFHIFGPSGALRF